MTANHKEIDFELNRRQERILELEKQIEQLKEEMKRARIFITSREKMHPDGIALYDELLKSK